MEAGGGQECLNPSHEHRLGDSERDRTVIGCCVWAVAGWFAIKVARDDRTFARQEADRKQYAASRDAALDRLEGFYMRVRELKISHLGSADRTQEWRSAYEDLALAVNAAEVFYLTECADAIRTVRGRIQIMIPKERDEADERRYDDALITLRRAIVSARRAGRPAPKS